MALPFYRGRRTRQNRRLRDLCRQTAPLSAAQLIMPYFVVDSPDLAYAKEIPSMPGQFQLGLDALQDKVAGAVECGLRALMLFGVPAAKDIHATGAYAENGIVQQALRRLRAAFPDLLLISDVCLCEYMSHGHCGILKENGEVDNDSTLPLLARTAVSHVKAGADMVAPSDMMDGTVLAIREGLDSAGFLSVPVMAYAVKYASSYYGPFREAAESAPACGDRKSYQMDPGNAREALLEARADVEEGADILIVKPAAPYADILHLVRSRVDVPLAAYQVSGEYAMIRAAGINGWIDEQAVIMESLLGLKRAGADMIITYFTQMLLEQGLVRA